MNKRTMAFEESSDVRDEMIVEGVSRKSAKLVFGFRRFTFKRVVGNARRRVRGDD